MILNDNVFIPGSNWVYFKIYTGPKVADEILKNEVYYILKELSHKKIIEKWFFIRYQDPEFHLRIRLLIKEHIYIHDVIQIFYKKTNKLVANFQVWKIQLDTYNPEINRYGLSTMKDSETIFYIDSECIVSILKKLNNRDENYRWLISLRMIDSLMFDFSYTLEEKMKLMSNLSSSFKKEFGFTEFNSKQLNSKYRENKKIIESILTISKENTFLNEFSQLINLKTEKNKPVVDIIYTKIKNTRNNINKNRNSLLISYIHMMLNRLFMNNNRVYELVLYDFMFRYYNGKLARIKYGN
jgi:thiopeptide-type bacteriocin biosynthesis protein